jgi:transposase
MRGSKGKVVFKDYNQHQMMLLPPSLDSLIAPHHPVRVVNEVIDRVDVSPIASKLSGGGASVYHPKMLLKVLIYGYMSNVYSSRKLEAALKENIHFMWLAAMDTPDHHTINRFRSSALNGSLREIFKQVVMLLVEEGLLSLKEVYIDGTKIESAAGRYTFVWAKSIETNKEKIKKQLNDLWDYTQQVAQEELALQPAPLADPISPESVAQTIESINNALINKPVPKKVKDKLNYAKKNWPKKLAEYEQKEAILQDRGSYSKTDPDATFMRMKEDHMGNGQLKPGYNCQISTNNQFVTNYTIHQTSVDTTTLETHLTAFEKDYSQSPSLICADAGYGSEENYQLLSNKNITAIVKYNYYQIEQTRKWLVDPFKLHNLFYNKEHNYYVCPMGQHLVFKDTHISKTKTGFGQEIHKYQAANCQGCPLRGQCYQGKAKARTIEVNHNLNHYRKKAKEVLDSELGEYHRKRRGIEVESVFGNIKGNHQFRRFHLRGLEKVEIEFGLLALAQNMRKKAALIQ